MRGLICGILVSFFYSSSVWAIHDFYFYEEREQLNRAPAHSRGDDRDRHHRWDHDHDRDDPKTCRNEVISRTVAGPARYHTVYFGIQSTKVTIQNFQLRGEDGSVVQINTEPMAIDLQALGGPGQGLLVNTVGITLPENFQLAEIETEILASEEASVFPVNDASCDLKTPRKLNLYTADAFPMVNDSYLVKVQFSPLDSIQIDVVTTTTQKTCCQVCSRQMWADKSCEVSTLPPVISTVCKLANRRLRIASILGG